MRVRWLGWAGAEIEADGATVVIDPLADPRAVFAPVVPDADALAVPALVPAQEGRAVAGLLTHLHRDHADAAALSAALVPGAPVFEPESVGGEALENLALAQAEHELDTAGLNRHPLAPWGSATCGPFEVTALPAVDGSGDPQVSWLVEHDGRRVLHLGDTAFHGFWWRIALRHGPFDLAFVPVNGPVVRFPHRTPPSPFPVVLDPEQAAVAAEILGARLTVPMHHSGYAVDELYEPAANAVARFTELAAARGVAVRVLEPGETVDL